MAGSFGGTAKFGSEMLVSAGDEDVFVAKLDPQASLLWVKGFGGPGQDHAFGASIDTSGHLVVCGRFAGTVTFDNHVVNAMMGGADAFVMRLEP